MKVHLANSNAWSDGNEYIMGTASEVHTNALFDIYPNDTTITADFKGNTVQSGTPSPSAPVPVVGVGYLDGTAYKIPVEIGLSTQSIDLSAVQTIRYINRLVFDGSESWQESGAVSGRIVGSLNIPTPYNEGGTTPSDYIKCTHIVPMQPYPSDVYNRVALNNYQAGTLFMSLTDDVIGGHSFDNFLSYLQQQYTNGTPISVYYVLADPVTDTINEPLQKIGDYADSISNITLTTTTGAKSFGVDTAVKPSEITLNFRGWHPKDPKESTGGEWS